VKFIYMTTNLGK